MGADSIICAVNNFGQDDVYMYPVSKGKEYNGICYHTTSSPTNGYFAKDGSYTFCKVDFAPPATSGGTTKRDWTVTSRFTSHPSVVTNSQAVLTADLS